MHCPTQDIVSSQFLLSLTRRDITQSEVARKVIIIGIGQLSMRGARILPLQETRDDD